MGWFWGSPSDGESNGAKDPLRDLDPSLKAFLAKESPVKYNTTSSSPSATLAAAPIPQPASSSQSTTATSPSPASQQTESPTPSASLFPDGRYAHLWKTYTPQTEVEASGKSDQEKINDVLEGYNQRKAEIGRAALENCALEQGDVNECFRTGGVRARLTMCRAENRRLDRCYVMQAKFLRALGYLSTYDRPPEVDERIQMHADTLYHRMLEQEEAIDKAKAEGRPIPSFPPLITSKPKSSMPAASPATEKSLDDNRLKIEELSPSVQASLKKKLEGLSEPERRIEEMAIKAEIQAGEKVAEQLGSIYDRQAEERRKRKEEGKERIGDRISSIFGFR
ncbi:hypothetical protein OIDMADRAFT_162548 [Oidiodendron maius Zn]|uniref:Autophagy-related protein 6 n=1 Tax=Oidiodendron maius (strain Zn) TaxID=913774 RepID=A0A0C3HJ56_OIDMZ|nr:hypothetical protein OIDMADRAFT_162548 [Oidiodendron maius Zn]